MPSRKARQRGKIFASAASRGPSVVAHAAAGEARPLEERAIPHYYKESESRPVYRVWNYCLEQDGLSAFNYSYNAAAFGAQGGAANPLGAPLAPFATAGDG